MISLAGEKVFYEGLVHYLMKLEPMENEGHLSVRPRFFSLSFLEQSRYLFSIIHQQNKISTSALHHFTQALESHPHQNAYITHGILQLKRCCRNRGLVFESENDMDQKFTSMYVFAKKSEKFKDELIKKLLHCNGCEISQFSNKQHVEQSSKTAWGRNLDMSMNSIVTDEIQRPHKRVKGCQLPVNTDNRYFESHIVLGKEDRKSNESASIMRDEDTTGTSNGMPQVRTGLSQSICENADIVIVSSDSDDAHTYNRHVNKSSNNCKRKFRNVQNYTKTSCTGTSDSEEDKSIATKFKSNKQTKNSKPGSETDEVLQDDDYPEKTHEHAGSFRETGEFSEMKLQLCSLRDSLLSDSRDENFPTLFWDCLMNVNHAQLANACEILMLRSISENVILTLCDCMCTHSLSHQVEAAFLNSCLSEKLSSLTERASHTLLNILFSAIRQKPRITIEIISNGLENTRSGEHQCQVALSVCKSSFPVDYVCFFIKQLSTRNIPLNSHLTSALQALLNRGTGLDADTVKCLLSLLSNHSESLSNSAPFGKLLLTIISKFKASITNELWAVVAGMVDDHKSSLKGTLRKKLESERQ